MPRFAFALPRPRHGATALRSAAREVLGSRASEHKAFLLSRGIVRERVWAQTGLGSPALLLVLWDCDDVEEATRLDGPMTAHERWLADSVGAGTVPQARPTLLSGTTTTPTDAGSTQTMLAVPVQPDRIEAVRVAVNRLEGGDLSDAHTDLLARAGIREEWVWLQPGGGGLPPLLLVHWMLEDAATAAKVLQAAADPPTTAPHVLGVAGADIQQITAWEVEQLLAMHVRRSDSDDLPAARLAARLRLGLSRGRWDALARACHGGGTDGRQPTVLTALQQVRMAVGEEGRPVVDVLVGSRHILCLLEVDGGEPLAILATVRQGLVGDLTVLPGWPHHDWATGAADV